MYAVTEAVFVTFVCAYRILYFHFFEGGACVRQRGGAPVPWQSGTMASPSLERDCSTA